MDIEDIIFGIYITVCLIGLLIVLVVGVYTIATQKPIEIKTDYQNCICEKVSEE